MNVRPTQVIAGALWLAAWGQIGVYMAVVVMTSPSDILAIPLIGICLALAVLTSLAFGTELEDPMS